MLLSEDVYINEDNDVSSMIENINKCKNYIAGAYNVLRQFQESIMIRDFFLIILKKENSRIVISI